MSAEKMVSLLVKLSEKTRQGALDWEETDDAEAFQVAFANHVVRVRREPIEDNYGNFLRDSFAIELVDSKGRIVDELSSEDETYERENLKDLYEEARRKALKADEAINEILSKLK